ncbi:sure-like protein [Dichomitus squalens]|uniref:Sure-like protein n=1 Tax=Dichomitus squalens TaxID=114155 RepID=A0A4Q9PD72_9APHY|nr:sure-like protein [Dichomitus squalens LYAD-421 SS1]EJF62478.1 sure-like protein [Dichomitus squalens LYAD-421 SS1]TBU50156.1 sure-like protein [Dichomitus squalens]TBU66176.1 sure-like protein [Dichomitus squalens]
MWKLSALLLAFVSCAAGLNILVTNDDSWASANIRAAFDALKADGHNVLLVGPAIQQSGKGGTFVLPTTNITHPGGEFDSIPAGAPFFGADSQNGDLFYFNGTPSATVTFGIDIIAPKKFGSTPIDLVVSGPNEGQNNGPFLYTLSGTIGATYTAVERGIPAIAFSAGNGTHRSFTTNTGEPNDPANLAAQVVKNLVAIIAAGVNASQERLLPLGVGLNVNIPTFGPASNCTAPPFVFTRLTGGATVNSIAIDNTTGLPVEVDLVATGVNSNINGVREDPGETPTSADCFTAVSIFSVDYDAPERIARPIQHRLRNSIRSTQF